MLILLSHSWHIALSYVLGLLFAFLAFTYPFIQDFVLKREKYVEALLEQYNAMEPGAKEPGQKRLVSPFPARYRICGFSYFVHDIFCPDIMLLGNAR